MGFIETSYGGKPNLSDVNIDSNLNLGTYGITTDGTLNINNSDLIGVKRFICQDYLGALKATGSDNLFDSFTLNQVSGYSARTNLFRIPSNFIAGSSIKIGFHARRAPAQGAGTFTIYIEKYDPDTATYQTITYVSGTTDQTIKTSSFNVNAGELFCLSTNGGDSIIYGDEGVSVYCDTELIAGAIWEVVPNE